MMDESVQDGQHTDSLKEKLILPELLAWIQRKEVQQNPAVLDIGCGDGSAVLSLTKHLSELAYKPRALCLLDYDPLILRMVYGWLKDPNTTSYSLEVIQSGDKDVMLSTWKMLAAAYDIALAQLVFHQIHNRAEVSRLLLTANMLLSDDGNLLVVNLHQKYLIYLTQSNSPKFRLLRKGEDFIDGIYTFDSGRSVDIHSVNAESQIVHFSRLGFDLQTRKPLFTTELADENPRYRELAELNIPMFDLLALEKTQRPHVTYFGIVNRIVTVDDRYARIEYTDGKNLELLNFDALSRINSVDLLIVHIVSGVTNNDKPNHKVVTILVQTADNKVWEKAYSVTLQ